MKRKRSEHLPRPRNAAQSNQRPIDSDAIPADPADETPNPLTPKQIDKKLFHIQRQIRKMYKHVRTIETQKAVRRLKQAKSNESELELMSLLERELECTKKLNLDSVSAIIFYTKLKKHPLHKIDHVSEWLKTSQKPSEIGHTEDGKRSFNKVIARFLSNKQVTGNLQELFDNLYALITGSETDKVQRQRSRTIERKVGGADIIPSAIGGSDIRDISDSGENAKGQNSFDFNSGNDDVAKNHANTDGRESISGAARDGGDNDIDGGLSGTNNFYELDRNGLRFETALVGKKIDPDSQEYSQEGRLGTRSNRMASGGSAVDDRYEDGYDSDGLPIPDKKLKSGNKLPSLSHGFTLGEDESDVTDDHMTSSGENFSKHPNANEKKKKKGIEGLLNGRKNRLGQRARRQLWEKIHGERAYHVSKEKEDKRMHGGSQRIGNGMQQKYRQSATIPSRGVGRRMVIVTSRNVENGNHKNHGRFRNNDSEQGTTTFAENRNRSETRRGEEYPRPDSKVQKVASMSSSLHPSWEAKRKQQGQMANAIDYTRVNKIVFD